MERSLSDRERTVGSQALSLGLDRLERELVSEEPLESQANRAAVETIAHSLVESGLVDRVELYSAGECIAVYPSNLPALEVALQGRDRFGVRRLDLPELGPMIVAEGVVTSQGRQVGILRTVHSTMTGVSQLRSAQLLIGLYTLLSAVFVVIIGYVLLTRIIVSPIRRIGVAAQRIAEGDHASRVKLRSQNEIGWLAQNVNHMLDRLDEGRSNLQQQVEALGRAKAELEDAQEAMIRSEKLASIGQLAAGVAHEMGNPLSAVIGLVELMKDGEAVSEDEREDVLSRIEKELMRINRIIRDLLDYSRTPVEEADSSSLQLAVESVVKLVEAQPIFRDVEIDVKLDDQLPLVAVSNDRLVQILLNLLLNAAEAMEGSGKIKISACQDQEQLRLCVEDDGPGIDPEVWNRLFEPFFTTKASGKGTGLGLAICERIVETAGGKIEVDSGPPTGAKFTVTLRKS